MKRALVLSLVLTTACTPVSKPTSIELCERTVRDYGPLRDEGPADTYADLFTNNGEFHLGPNVTKGREALIARHTKSNADTQWRHNMTDIRITDTAGKLSGTTRFQIFTGPKGEKPAAPAREIIGDYLDEFIIEYGVCKITTRKIKILFDTLN